MPAEPDNQKIEELLKAYAKKRREEVGASPELHPAMRKMLQAEVAKQRPAKSAAQSSFLSLFLHFWPRLAIGGAAAMLLSLVLLNINQHPNGPESERTELAQAAGRSGFKEQQTADRWARESESLRGEPSAPPAPEGVSRDLDQLSRKKVESNVRLQRELKLAQNEKPASAATPSARAPAPRPNANDYYNKDAAKLVDPILQLKGAEELDSLRPQNAPVTRERGRFAEVRQKSTEYSVRASTEKEVGAKALSSPVAGPKQNPSPELRASGFADSREVKSSLGVPSLQPPPADAPAQTLAEPVPAKNEFGVSLASGTAAPQTQPPKLAFRSHILPATPAAPAPASKPSGQPPSTTPSSFGRALGYDPNKGASLFDSLEASPTRGLSR